MPVDEAQLATQEDVELYDGIADYYDANKDWITEFGFEGLEDFNKAVDSYHSSYVESVNVHNELFPDEVKDVKYPTPASYAATFLDHMRSNEEKYRQAATEKRYRREALERAQTVDKPIRMKRVEEVRQRTERISDVFKGLDIEGVDPNSADVQYWLDETGYATHYAISAAVRGPEDKENQAEAILNAMGSVMSNRNAYIFNLFRRSNQLLVFRADAFDTWFINTSSLSVGEYGPEASQKIAQAVKAVAVFLKENEAHFSDLHEEFGHTLIRSQDNVDGESVPMLSLYEGVLTIGQALNSLIQEKVDGYENVDDLVRDLVDQGVLLKFARTFTSTGQIGPMNLAGYYIPNLVSLIESKSGAKRLKLNDEYLEEQSDSRKARLTIHSGRVAASILAGDDFDTKKPETVLSLEGCPATHSSYNRETGESRNVVNELARVFLAVYKKVDPSKLPEPKRI